jgi:predicted DNA-binding protein with PD1-like motif
MRVLLLAVTLLATTGLLVAQESRMEVTKPTTPADDAKANSDSIPDVYALNGQFERVVVLRFKYQADLLAGMEKIVKEQNIRNAVILAGAGSLTGYHFHLVSNRTFPSKNIFIKNPAAPADLVSMNGYIIDGRIHAHMTLTNEDEAFGGHLESGTTVFTFAIVTVGVFKEGIDLRRIDDKTYR